MGHEVVLLLGGGFIATALARQLTATGKVVHVVARRPASAEFPRTHWHQGDLRDRELLSQLLPVCGTVVHLASETTPGASAHHPLLEGGNLQPTLTLLDALQDYPDHHLIYFSSGGTVYGNPACLPVTEDAPLAPLSFHGAGKVAQEMFLQAFRAQERAVTILRPANAYGPGQPLKSGFGLVRTVLDNIRHGRPIEVWGDGESVRDFVYVDDVAAACAMLIDRPGDSCTYNVGSGMGCSINALIHLAGETAGQTPQVVYRAARRSDVARVVLDVSRLRAAGWAPRMNLAEGLLRTWEWLTRNN
jgi:UDP-glucose 4-epimerase